MKHNEDPKRGGGLGRRFAAVVSALAMLGTMAATGTAVAATAGDEATPDVSTTTGVPVSADKAVRSVPAPRAKAAAEPSVSGSLLVNETFRNSTFSEPDKWSTTNDACLTAGYGNCKNTEDTSDIQGNQGDGYLQLTDGSTGKRGAVLYN
ncbi:hypothetical protein CS006_03920 [Bifidobacterium primatium]|uniref:Cell surface protein n=1 Tax=Bifidobacterium primatium TaxID=2045438 RepID=A0A2M9H8R5_9BIFI|nr:hypothetical protein [Bifidobacterium primatium]PJM73214.1 hypothetical protein CS006_03920 [Bifidobacterium primatium]